jgi:iron complex transport system substrate-binding protein
MWLTWEIVGNAANPFASSSRTRMNQSLGPSCSWMCCFGLLAVAWQSLGCDHRSNDAAHLSAHRSAESPTTNIVLVDRLQRTVTLSRLPERIVSLAPATTELMFAIGAGHLLVGATEHCNYPPEAVKIARIGGGTMQGISHETIVSLRPDLILGKWDTHQTLIDIFDRLKIPMLAIGPESLEQLYDEANLLGRATGHDVDASKLIDHMKQKSSALTRGLESIPIHSRPRVFYEVWDEPLMTVGPNSFIGELIEMGGMKNLFADATTSYPRVSDEIVIDRDPDVILAPSTHRDRIRFDILSKRPGWDRIRAVRDRQVFFIDGDKISRCGPRMLDALEEMIQAVYPDTLPLDLSLKVFQH